MPTRELLWLAAILLVFIGVAHSYLGERFILNRLLALSNLPLLRRDRGYTERMFRYAWHITSVYFWGCAAILAVLAFQGTVDVRTLGMVLAAIFLVSAAITLPSALVTPPGRSSCSRRRQRDSPRHTNSFQIFRGSAIM